MYKEFDGSLVVIMLCSDCNIKCKHCYINYHGNFKPEKLNLLIEKFKGKYEIMFNGTEPLLHKEYIEFFKKIGQRKIFTNGLELINNYELTKILKKNDIDEISISYHFGIHKDISCTTENEIFELIRKLKNDNFTVRILTTIDKDNYKEIEKFCNISKKIGADGIKFTNLIIQGSAITSEISLKKLNREEIMEFIENISKERNNYDIKDFKIERCGSFGNLIKTTNFDCWFGNKMVVVTPDMKVYGCVFGIGKGNEIGYIDSENNIIINTETFDKRNNYCKVLKKYNNIG